jgi:Penicillin-Binding Protein C-terminus Family
MLISHREQAFKVMLNERSEALRNAVLQLQPPAEGLAGGREQIRTPVAGEVMALDVDIPQAHQPLAFAADGTSAGQCWLCNGREIRPATGLQPWEPVPRQHTLSLINHCSRALATVSFVVRPELTRVDSPPSQTH